MERTLLFTFYLLLSYISYAQQINWAKATSSDVPMGTPSRGLLCDNQGNLYNYGSRELNPHSNQNEGSFLTKYSSSGQLLLSKFWSFPFVIKKMIYDGSNNFYVAGSVGQATVINSILVPTRGNYDGFIGKMDLNGNFVWIKTFGASSTEECNGITFNTTKNKLVVTGAVQDSLYVNTTYIAKSSGPAMLLASFDLSGKLVGHKLVDFEPTLNNPNCGKEIMADNAGNFLVYGAREGKFWSNDTSNLTDEGQYIFKFNPYFHLNWSTFVINSACYYGYNCGNMNVDNAGNTYIASFCSSKYGGNGCIKKIDASGAITWSLNVDDANGYLATPVDNNLIICGEEGASIYPGPGTHGGYQVIKKLDHNKNVVGESRFEHIHIMRPAVYHNGVFYVTGYFYSGADVALGKDTLNSGQGPGTFIAQFSDINCEPVIADSLAAPFHVQKNFCPQNSMTLDAGPGYSSYLWNNGVSTRTMQTNKSGSYVVKVTQASGCKAYSLPINLNALQPDKVSISKVSYDKQSGNNKIYYSYYTYDQVGTQYMKLHKIINSDTNVIAVFTPTNTGIVDSLSHLDTSPAGYYITRIDTCGTESEPEKAHWPIFLSSGAYKLNWTTYPLFAHQDFHLLKGATKENLQTFTVVPWSNTSYALNVDTNYYYQVMVRLSGSWEFNSYSNIVKGSALNVGVLQNNKNASLFEIYPNPNSGKFNLRFTNQKENGSLKLRIVNVMGKTVRIKNLVSKGYVYEEEIDLSAEQKGIYIVQIETSDHVRTQKRIVVQ